MAAVDYYLKLDGIDGESHDDGHKGEIDVESFSWGATNSAAGHAGGGHGAGKVVLQDIHFVSKMSKASPKLMLACASGEHIKKGTLVARKAGGKQQEYLTIKLEDLVVTTYQTGGSAHGDVVPTDQFSVNFAKVVVEYKEQKQDGSLAAGTPTGWDAKANKKV